ADTAGVHYGAFSGFLGAGRMELLQPIGGDVWALPCPRALDHTPPGDWTLAFQRDDAGPGVGVEVGCWLARRLGYHPAVTSTAAARKVTRASPCPSVPARSTMAAHRAPRATRCRKHFAFA